MSAPMTLPQAADVLAIEAVKSALGQRIADIDHAALTSVQACRLGGILGAALPLFEEWAAVTAAGDVPDADDLDDYRTGFAAVGDALDAMEGLN